MTNDPHGLRSGALARLGLLDEEAIGRGQAVIDEVEADGIETVRLMFADQHGTLRGKTVVAGALASALRNGINVPSTLLLKDTSGTTVFPVWTGDIGLGAGTLTGASDVMLVPVPSSFRTLPWSAQSGWMLCDVHFRDGTPIPFASRTVLRTACDRLEARGMRLVCGLEVEFYVYRVTAPHLDHEDGGMPPTPPETSLIAHGYQHLTEARYDAMEEITEMLRRACQHLDLPVRSIEAEFGPDQCEFTFAPGAAMDQADALVLFRSMVKQVCARQGLHATFMCRPRVAHSMASGWHVHQSLVDSATGANLFVPGGDGAVSAHAGQWIAGLLAHAAESCLMTTPTVNGYKRYQPFQLAPDRIQWGFENRGAMIRALMAPGDTASRVENRAPDSAANPHYCLAAQILSGLDGLENKLDAPAASENPYQGDGERLPSHLGAAIDHLAASAFYRSALGDAFVDYLTHIKRAEWTRYLGTVSDWEQREYFSLF